MAILLIDFNWLILTIHFIVAIFLIAVILLQSGKGGDIGAAFGAGGSQSLFGARGAATLLSKLTTIGAIVFLLTSLSLATISKFKAQGTGSLIEDELSAPAPKLEDADDAKQEEPLSDESKEDKPVDESEQDADSKQP